MRYTGVLHMHSTHSYDGKLALPELKALLKKEGISFACMSEHTDELTKARAEAFVAECRALSDESFVFVPGFEVPYLPARLHGQAQAGQDAHVLMLGTDVFLGQSADAHMLSVWAHNSEFVVLAHPVRNSFVVDDALLGVLDGIEIWNQQYDGKRAPRTRAAALYDRLKAQRHQLLRTGGLDLHRAEHFGTPFTYLETSELSEAAVMNALKRGLYTFGEEGRKIPPHKEWAMPLSMRLQSAVSVRVVTAGKRVNAFLALFGLSFPKSLKRAVRRKI